MATIQPAPAEDLNKLEEMRKRKDPFYRVLLARVFKFLVSSYFGHKFTDINSGFRLMRREAIQEVLDEDWYMKHLINFEFTLRILAHGFRVTEVSVSHRPRPHGPSRGLPLKKIPEAVLMALRTFPRLRRELRKIKNSGD